MNQGRPYPFRMCSGKVLANLLSCTRCLNIDIQVCKYIYKTWANIYKKIIIRYGPKGFNGKVIILTKKKFILQFKHC